MMNFDVFISYSSQDKPAADAACATLENAGIRCWIAPRDIRPGQDWDESIVRAIDQCRAMVLIFTQHTNDSKQVGREVKRAFNKEIPVIPMRVENAMPGETLGFYLDTVHWLDAFTPPLEQHLKELSEVVKAILDIGRPGPVPRPNPEPEPPGQPLPPPPPPPQPAPPAAAEIHRKPPPIEPGPRASAEVGKITPDLVDRKGSPKKAVLNVLLIIGIFFMPYIFAWFTLGKGYSTKFRLISFGWMVVVLVASLIVQIVQKH